MAPNDGDVTNDGDATMMAATTTMATGAGNNNDGDATTMAFKYRLVCNYFNLGVIHFGFAVVFII